MFALLEASGDAVSWVQLDIAAIYGIPLVLAAIARSRRLLWILTLLLTATTFGVYAAQIPAGVFWLGETFFVNRLLDAAAVLLTAGLLHLWLNSLDTTEAQAQLLEDQNNRLEAANAELIRNKEQICRQNEELDHRRREAEEASARKTMLLTSASHDIRGPVNTLGLMAEVIRRAAEDPVLAPSVKNLAAHLQASALSLVDLVSAMLDVAHFESGRLQYRESVFSLNEMITSICRDWRPAAQAKRLRLQATIPGQTIWLRTDQFKLKRVVSNLISNAIKFTENGDVTVSVALTNGTASLCVRDTGIGMAQAQLDRIFAEFVQLDDGNQDRGSGWGLGLAICRRLVDIVGGTITVESAQHHGSAFTVRLPSKCVVDDRGAGLAALGG